MNAPPPVSTSPTIQLLDRIYQHIHRQPVDGEVGLLSGQMGYALLEAYANRFFGQTDDSRIWERLSASLEAVQQGGLSHSFADGMAGVAWGFLHLCNHGLVQTDDLDAQDVVADLDEALFELSLEPLQNGDYDYLHGGLSAGLYFLERQPNPAIARYVEHLVETLNKTALRFPNGDITWPFTDFGRRKPGDPIRYNPGLSHGTASIASLLSLFYERGYARARCAELIRGTLQWIWNTRNRSGLSVFPTLVSDPRTDQDSRLSWCYGDMGIASAFALCGLKFGHQPWQSIAYETMRKAAQRREPADTNVYDAGFCHGSAGLAYLFRRLARPMANPVLAEAADYWMQQTLAFALPDTDENVLLAYDSGNHFPNLGLLDGESSVGLVLLAELGGPPSWERFLLLA
ncbi:lanthionine synthetase C family protein [Larkinella sp. VNQ87]|uniref:lanthionine synthetase C family protein n=1 Tax=Larkinella sp. VNQ87 TaxID=3400921 RepID=UPI003C12054C